MGADTIVAPATPPGTGGVGIVRISGEGTEAIGRAVLGSSARAAYRDVSVISRQAPETRSTRVLRFTFRLPRLSRANPHWSFTGTAGPWSFPCWLMPLVEMGARQAEPGEFSKRAFLNDKLDLVQAEAIADLIDSGTAQAARAALRSMSGAFSERR